MYIGTRGLDISYPMLTRSPVILVSTPMRYIWPKSSYLIHSITLLATCRTALFAVEWLKMGPHKIFQKTFSPKNRAAQYVKCQYNALIYTRNNHCVIWNCTDKIYTKPIMPFIFIYQTFAVCVIIWHCRMLSELIYIYIYFSITSMSEIDSIKNRTYS